MNDCAYCGEEFKNGQEVMEWDYDSGTLTFCDEDCAASWFQEQLIGNKYGKVIR